jgi:predicted 3-demethylubiquinone-9 3-methyltransferase (glyoxalase superfamily)
MENNQTQRVTPFLMYNNNLGEALELYTSVFKNMKVLNKRSLGGDSKMITATFEIGGQKLMAFDGGPHFKFSEAISLFVNCDTQEEVDELWEKLTANGGEESKCGWLKDKFGVSWQIIPKQLMQYMSDPNPAKAGRVMNAMMQMGKIIIKDLEDAYNAE